MTIRNKRMALVCAGLALCNGLVAASVQAQGVSFEDARNFAVGRLPISVAEGDFNGDGVPDLVVSNYLTGNVSVLLGNGDGSFQDARSFDAGLNPYSMAVGDFNGDGVPDLAVVNYRTDHVSVLLGNGDGSFQAAQSFGAAGIPGSVAVGDFNGDGRLDLVTTNFVTRDVSVFLGNGDGSFQVRGYFGAGSGPSSVAVGDFNGDGVPDLAVANAGSSPYFRDGSISILLGTGDGGFTGGQTMAAGDGPLAIAIADFNGDGTSDLVIANNGYFVDDGMGGYIFVAGTTSRLFLGNGSGTFRSGVVVGVGAAPFPVAVGDFNGDGALDLAVANQTDNNVSVVLGNGDGSFQEARSFGVGLNPFSVAVGDFNGDGLPDLAVANNGSNNVSVLINNTRP